jgi:hypothetical protein
MAGEESHKNLEKNKGKEDEMHKEDDNAKFDVSEGSKKSGDHNKKSKSKSKSKRIVIESSSSSTSSSDEWSIYIKRRKKKKSVTSNYSRTSFNYDNMSSNNNFLSVSLGKPPHFDGTNYSQWRTNMRWHLFSLHPSLWEIVCVGIEQLDSDYESFGPTMQQLFHHNAQAATILLSSLSREEFDKVDGLQSAKEIWYTLKVAHEGTKTIRKARIEMIEGELGRFTIFDDETPQEMYTRLKKMINQVRSLGSKKWTDHEVVKRMIRAFSVRNIILCTLIRESPNYKKMTPEEVLGKIINHEMMESEAKYVKSLSKGTSTSRGQDIALKANKKEKSKKVVQESSSSDNGSDSSSLDDDDMALLMRNFNKLMRNRNYKGNKRHESSKRRTKRNCYNCGKCGHFIANCPYEKKEDKEEKRKNYKEKKYFTKDKKFFKKK